MALGFKIRTAVPEDAEKILEFARQVGAETDYLSFGAEGLPISLEGEQAHLARIREEPRMRYILAMADDEVIGLAALESPGRERMKHRASISLSVRKKYWGQGAGTRFMEELTGFARTIGVELITLEVLEENRRAIRLYERFGFTPFGRLERSMKLPDRYCAVIYMKLDL